MLTEVQLVHTPLTTVQTRDLHSRGQQHQDGARDKFINNLLVTVNTAAIGEAVSLALKSGVDPEMMIKAITNGSGGSVQRAPVPGSRVEAGGAVRSSGRPPLRSGECASAPVGSV